jgi:hypothetical protein
MAEVPAMVKETERLNDELSAAEAVLPMQFYGARRGAATIEPLRRLMVAMLVDAVRCFQTTFEARQQARRQEFAEVRSWIFSDEDNGVFSFKAVCDALEIDPEAIRKELVRWEERRLSGPEPRMKIRRSPVPLAKRISR